MERCDFASVTTIIRNNLLDGNFENQIEFAESLFSCYLEENEIYFDAGLLNKWLNGVAKLSPSISQFYSESPKQQKALALTLEDVILPCLSDSAMAVQQIYELLIRDASISEQKKKKLCRRYPCKNISQEADFIGTVLTFGMSRPFVARDVRKPNLLTDGNRSPVLRDFIFDEGLPKPCQYFCGREQELKRLHEALVEDSKVFLHGIPGIGKSELAKAYAKEHKKDYTNILYLIYSGSLQKDIMNLDFADDLAEESQAERFRKHNRFMRTLKEDTLLIIDNFNTTGSQDEFLSVVLKYRCRVLFTTRSSLPGQRCVLVEEIADRETLFQLTSKFYSDAEKQRPVVEGILEAVHYHTLAAELAARLLESGILQPREVLDKLREEKAAFDAADKIRISKDGKSRQATYYDHIHTLFALFRLSPVQREIMRCLTLIPLTGISARLFGRWMDFYHLNDVNELVELGFVQSKPGNQIALHPMVQEVAVSDLPPSISGCRTMLENIRATCQSHGLHVSYYKVMFQTLENTVALAAKDDTAFYLRLLEDIFQYMDTYQYKSGMKLVISELSNLLGDSSIGTASDRALLLGCRSAMEQKPEKAIKLLEDALMLLPEIDADNALLVSNINANLGGLYRMVRKNNLAKQKMERALSILQEYDLLGYHDSLVQAVNYAALLNELGNPEQGLEGLHKMERFVRTINPDSVDYGIIHQEMGVLYMTCGKPGEAVSHFKKALSIYASLYADEPELLSEKQNEICHIMGLPISSL